MSTTTETTPAAPDQMDALRARVRGMRSDALPFATMAREAGIAPATFNLWLNGTYTGNNERVAEQVTRWLENRGAAQLVRSGLPAEPAVVVTPTMRRIINLLSYAQSAPTMAVVSGGAGIGKTSAIEHYAQTNPNVWVIVGQPACKSPNVMLADLAEVVGVAEKSSDRRSSAILRRLRGTSGLLILDEAHHYPTLVLEQVRHIFDQAKIGVAMLGNAGIYGRLEGEGRSEKHAPLFRRIGMKLTLPRTTQPDVSALLDAWGVDGAVERKLLGTVAAQPGALGGMAGVLRMAHMLAAGSTVTALHIREAHMRLREVPIAGDAP